MFNNKAIYPYVSQLLNELILWTNLSKEHPVFIKEISLYQEIDIDNNLKELLNKSFKDFNIIRKKLMDIKNYYNFYSQSIVNKQHLLLDISIILKDLLRVNMEFLEALKLLEKLPSRDNSWGAFINHITIEQRQLLQISTSHSTRIKSMVS